MRNLPDSFFSDELPEDIRDREDKEKKEAKRKRKGGKKKKDE